MSRACIAASGSYVYVRARASYPLQLLRERMMTRGLLGLVPREPGAALLVVLGEDEPDRLSTAAFAEKTVVVPVCGGSRYRNSGHAELVVE